MFTGLLHLHSFLRWISLIILLVATFKALSGWINKKTYTSGDNKLSLVTMIVMHTQLLIGLILYFKSEIIKIGLADMASAMKNPELRFWTVEHSSMMILAIALITIGRISSKKVLDATVKHKKQALFFLIGLLIIMMAIPWPFSKIVRPLF